jgi:hypothetical protein
MTAPDVESLSDSEHLGHLKTLKKEQIHLGLSDGLVKRLYDRAVPVEARIRNVPWREMAKIGQSNSCLDEE